jgi:hypothetical protein
MTSAGLIAIGLGWLAGGCALEAAPEGEASPEKVESSTQNLTAETAWGSMRNGGAEVALRGSNNTPFTAQDGLCYLTHVAGAFKGSGDEVRVRRWLDGTWHLGGKGASGWAEARARCVRYDEVVRDNAGWLSDYEKTFTKTIPTCPWWNPLCAKPATPDAATVTLAPVASSVCYLTSVGGELNGSGEGAYVRQSGANWELVVASQSGAGVTARATCANLYRQPQYWASYEWSQGKAAVPMLDQGWWFCGLNGVRGKFRGWGEEVWVRPGAGNRWTLGGASQQQGVWGKSDCYFNREGQRALCLFYGGTNC